MLVLDLPPAGGSRDVLAPPVLQGGFGVDGLYLQSVARRRAVVCVSKPLGSSVVVHTVPHPLNTYLEIVCVCVCHCAFNLDDFQGHSHIGMRRHLQTQSFSEYKSGKKRK